MKVYILLFTVLFSCKKPGRVENQPIFEAGRSQGSVSSTLEEASGLIAGIANPGYLWTHNDSGNPAEVYLINEKAEIVLTCELRKIENRDWEDIAIGPGPELGIPYLYVGELGDNEAKYDLKYLYRFKEPVLARDSTITIDEVDTLVVKLADGKRDMEALTIDRTTGDLYFVSKREEAVNVYWLNHELLNADTLIPQNIGTLPFSNVVAADLSSDGKELILKTYGEIMYWKRNDSLSIHQLFIRKPEMLEYDPEPQGESVAWKLDGSGFYTLSESKDGEAALLFFYKRTRPEEVSF